VKEMPNHLFIDLKDIRFALFDIFKICDLTKHEGFQHLDGNQIDDILNQAERMAREVIFPVDQIADQSPPEYRDGKVTMPKAYHSAFNKYCEGGWIPITLARKAGGHGFSESLATAVKEIFNSASGGFYAFSSLTLGVLNLIEAFGSEQMKKNYLANLAKGKFTGTMCLSEPEAGSFLADTRTIAKRDGDHFKISGKKVFIGAGEHDLSENIVHCILARIEGAPEGYKGISLFVVPKYRVNEDGTIASFNNAFCEGTERKMGHEGAPTARLHFGDGGDCHGWLLGEEGQGLSQIFQMMNELRLGTAIQGVGQAAAAYQTSLSYTKQRVQGLSYSGKMGDPAVQVPIINHPDIRRNLLFMKAIVEGCRRLNIQTGFYIDLSKTSQNEKERQYYHDLAEILTPICKAYATDMGFRVTETALQSMGGYGYVKDYHVEQYLRDIKVASIYEGTNGIQAIDLTRRKLNIHEGRLFKNLCQEIKHFIDQNLQHPVLGASIGELKRAKEVMVEASGSFSGKFKEDPGLCLSAAKPFLDLTGHVLCTWMLLKSAVVANSLLENPQISEKDRIFYAGKILSGRFAVSNLLPQVDALAKTITAKDRSILDMEEDGF